MLFFLEEVDARTVCRDEREKQMFSHATVGLAECWRKMKFFASIVELIVYEDSPRDPEDDEDEKKAPGQ